MTYPDPFATGERAALRDTMSQFVTREIHPHLAEWEKAGEIPRDLHARAAKAGLYGIGFSEEHGGEGGDTVDTVVATEAFSHRNQGCSVEDTISAAVDVVRDARAAGLATTVTIAVAFGCPFTGEVDPRRISDIVARLADEAASLSLFGGARYIRVTGIGDDALAACERIEARYHRRAEEARAARERAVSPLLVKAGATECAKAIRAMLAAPGG